MRIVYFGTSEFAVPPLEAVAAQTVLVVTQPDRPSGRGMSLHPSPVKRAAMRLGLPVETPAKSRAPEFVARLAELKPDLFVVASYGQLLSKALLDTPARGCYNLHGSLLPKYRGAAPIQRCVLEGEAATAVTLMRMAEGLDTGDMVAKEALDIGPDETAGELHDRLAQVAAQMIAAWLPALAGGDVPRQAQDGSLATYAKKVEKEEAGLSFERPAAEEYNRFRAFTPAPGAFIPTSAGPLKLLQVRLEPGVGGEPGVVLATRPELVVAFSRGALRLIEVQPAGKKRMAGRDFANGARLKPGSPWPA